MDFERFEDIPDNTYDVAYGDAPWSYTGDQGKWGAAAKFYPTMTDEELAALPVRRKLKKRAVAFLWATCPRLDACIDLIRAWDLHYRGVAFVWAKTRRDGVIVGAQGVRPSIIKPVVEVVLAASTVKDGRPLPLLDEGIEQMVYDFEEGAELIRAPKSDHSVKPAEVRTRIEDMYGEVRRLELFARGPAPVKLWDRFGNELLPREETVLELMGEEADPQGSR